MSQAMTTLEPTNTGTAMSFALPLSTSPSSTEIANVGPTGGTTE